jgi:hypothetical protein
MKRSGSGWRMGEEGEKGEAEEKRGECDKRQIERKSE